MDWRTAYQELWAENDRLQMSLAEANQTIVSHISVLERAKAEGEDLCDLRQEVAVPRDTLQVVSNLHDREYRDGSHWCSQCLRQWPCPTLHVINQIRNVFGW